MTRTSSPNYIIEYALLVILALLWGSSYLFLKIAVLEIPPLSLIAIRSLIAALFLIMLVKNQNLKLPRDAATWRSLLIQAFFNAFGAWTILAWGQQYVDSGLAAVLNSTSPIFVFLITFFVTRHESTSYIRLLGAIIGLFGVILIIGTDVLAGLGQQVSGQLAALSGAFLYGCAAIYGKRFYKLPASVTAAGIMIWSTIVLVPLALIIDRPWQLSVSANAILAALMLSLFSTALALLIYFRLIRTLGSMGVASQAYLRIGIAVMLGVIFLEEQISLSMALGLVAAILGVALINMRNRQRAQANS